MCSAHCLNLVNGDVIGSCSRLGRGFTNSISYDLLMDLDLFGIYPIYPTLDGDMTTRFDGKMDGIATLLPKKSHHAKITRSTKTWPPCHFFGERQLLLAIHGYSWCNQWISQRETNSDSRNSELAHPFQGIHVENYLWGYVRVWTTSKPWPRIESDT